MCQCPCGLRDFLGVRKSKIFVPKIIHHSMPKSTKRFVLTDSSVNRYGFRVLTSGVDIEQFKKNPICYFSHKDEHGKELVLPIGHWQDIEVEGDRITAVPFLSDNDAFAMQIFEKVEEGTLRMASAGLDPLEASDSTALMLPGQVLPTVTRSIMYEASICPQGVNNNALTLSVSGRPVNLSTELPKALSDIIAKNFKNPNMNAKFLALAIQLGLTETANEDALAEALQKKVKSYDQLSAKVTDLETKLSAKNSELESMRKASELVSINAMLDKAETEGRLTAAERPEMLELATSNREVVEKMLAKRPVHLSAQEQLAVSVTEGDPLMKLSYQEADKQGKLAEIKQKNPAHFAALFEKEFGRKPKD